VLPSSVTTIAIVLANLPQFKKWFFPMGYPNALGLGPTKWGYVRNWVVPKYGKQLLLMIG